MSEVLVEVEVCWPRLRRAALAEMTREQKAAALARVQANRAMEAAWEAAIICSLAADLQGPAPSLRGVRGREVLRLCRSHHRLKTFAPGWSFSMDPDGTHHVTTPAGITRAMPPPGLDHPPSGAPPDGAPPGEHPTHPTGPLTDRAPDEDPPPF